MARRQTPRKEELVARITELRGQGKSWDDVTQIVTREGFQNASGGDYTHTGLSVSYARWIKEKAGMTATAESGPTVPSTEGMTTASETTPTVEPEQGQTISPETGPTPDPSLSGMTPESESGIPPEPEPVSTEPEKCQDVTTNGMTSTRESGMTNTDEGEVDPQPGLTQEGETGLTPEMRALISEFMEQEVRRIMAGITIEEIQKSGRGGTAQAVKKSFSIPLDVWTEFENRFRGSILSNHVAAALKMYLNLKPV